MQRNAIAPALMKLMMHKLYSVYAHVSRILSIRYVH